MQTPSVASLAADIATKEEFKYNPEVEAAAVRWIERVLGISSNGQSFHAFMKSGVVLCQLANKIQPQIVPSIYEGSLPYRQMENIGWYIKACQQLGLRDEELFETADLFVERNLNSVVNHIHVIAHWLAKREGWNGPPIEDVRDAKSLFSATLVESNLDKISNSSASSAPLTEEQKDLLAWANTKLRDYCFPPETILDLSNDLKNGVKLIKLLGAICRGQSVGIFNTNPTMVWHAMQNASTILNFVTSLTFEKVDGVRAVDIVTGNVTAISKLLFQLRAKFDLDYLFSQTLGDLSSSGLSSQSNSTDTSETISVELVEGEEVPGHLRPLMSAEDLAYYDRLAREQREEDEAALLAEQLASVNPPEEPSTPTKPKSRRSSTSTKRKSGSRSGTPSKSNPINETDEVEVVEESHVIQPHHLKPLEGTGSSPSSGTSRESPPTSSELKGTKRDKKDDKDKEKRAKKSKGSASPKLKDSADSLDKKQKTKSRRDKFVAGSTDSGDSAGNSTGTNTVDVVTADPVPLGAGAGSTSPSNDATEQKAPTSTVTVPPMTLPPPTPQTQSDAIEDSARNDSQSSIVSPRSDSSGTSSLSGTPRGPMYGVRRPHTRERSVTRKVNLQRTATIGHNKVVVTDQEKVLRAQQVVRKHVAVEVMTTEQSYLNHMRILIREVLEPVKRSKILTTEEYNSVFSNYEQIVEHHTKFEKLISARLATWDDNSTMSDIFLHHTAFFNDYAPYLTNYNQATVAMRHLRKKHPKFDQVIKNFEDDRSVSNWQSADSFLVMPVQRLPRYVLLLRDMRKYTAPSWEEHLHLEQASHQVDSVLHELNSHIPPDGAEQIKKMLSIEDSIQGEMKSGLMKVDRKFLKEGQVYLRKLKIGDKTKAEKKRLAERISGTKVYLFLFNDLLVITEQLKHAKSDDKCHFGYLHMYNISDSLIVTEKERIERSMDQIANFPLKHPDKKSKDNVYLHTESDLIILNFQSAEEREAWVSLFPKK